jgi:hypothetical protein
MSQSLIPSGNAETAAVSPALSERLERQVFAPARVAGIENLAIAAVTDPPPPTEAKRSPEGTWWVASTFELDPVAQSNGGFTKAPAEVVTGLHSMGAAGVDFDYVYVLNELPPDWTPGSPAPKMQLIGADATGSAQVVRTQETVFAMGIEALRMTAQALGTVVKGTAVVGGAAVAGIGQAIVLDPVVLGGLKDPESDKIAWVPLAAWDETPV